MIEEVSDSNYERESNQQKVSDLQPPRNSQNNSVGQASELVFVPEEQESHEMSVDFGSEDELNDYAAYEEQMAFIQSDFIVQHKEFKRQYRGFA